jgi:hypothetical protein
MPVDAALPIFAPEKPSPPPSTPVAHLPRWYLGWKSLFPDALLDYERVRLQMSAALNAMNSAVDGRLAMAMDGWGECMSACVCKLP